MIFVPQQSFLYVFLVAILLFGGVFIHGIFADSQITIDATIQIAVCGNDTREADEQCDGPDLGGNNCITRGFSGGTLLCSPSCEFNTNQCTTTPPPSGGGGGGGGGFSPPQTSSSVLFSGRAYPQSVVTLLKDAQVVGTTVANSDAQFQLNVSGISSGNYIFSLYSEDNKGIRSSLLTFPVSVTGGVSSTVSGVFLAPSITTDKSEVRRGDIISIFGQSTPFSDITLSINSEHEIFIQEETDENGAYIVNFNTSVLEMGQHSTRARSALNNEVSSLSRTVGFTVGTRNVLAELPTPGGIRGDFNGDGRINLIDFSIAAFWYQRTGAPAHLDLNSDGKIDLIDFSIMAFHWTG